MVFEWFAEDATTNAQQQLNQQIRESEQEASFEQQATRIMAQAMVRHRQHLDIEVSHLRSNLSGATATIPELTRTMGRLRRVESSLRKLDGKIEYVGEQTLAEAEAEAARMQTEPVDAAEMLGRLSLVEAVSAESGANQNELFSQLFSQMQALHARIGTLEVENKEIKAVAEAAAKAAPPRRPTAVPPRRPISWSRVCFGRRPTAAPSRRPSRDLAPRWRASKGRSNRTTLLEVEHPIEGALLLAVLPNQTYEEMSLACDLMAWGDRPLAGLLRLSMPDRLGFVKHLLTQASGPLALLPRAIALGPVEPRKPSKPPQFGVAKAMLPGGNVGSPRPSSFPQSRTRSLTPPAPCPFLSHPPCQLRLWTAIGQLRLTP